MSGETDNKQTPQQQNTTVPEFDFDESADPPPPSEADRLRVYWYWALAIYVLCVSLLMQAIKNHTHTPSKLSTGAFLLILGVMPISSILAFWPKAPQDTTLATILRRLLVSVIFAFLGTIGLFIIFFILNVHKMTL